MPNDQAALPLPFVLTPEQMMLFTRQYEGERFPDGRPKVRFALRVLLERQPQLKVVGEASNAYQLLAQVGMVCPDLVLLGWELPGWMTSGSVALLRDACPSLYVIALSGRPEDRQAALQAGADSFVSKVDPPERLFEAIDECLAKSANGKAASRVE